jgi:hypothetical protein
MADTWADLTATQKTAALLIDGTAETTVTVAAAAALAEVIFRSEVSSRRYWLDDDGSVINDPDDLSAVINTDLPSPASDAEVAWYRTQLATRLGCTEAQADRRSVVLAARLEGLTYPG